MEPILPFLGGVAAAALGAVVAVGIEIWRRTRKTLGYQVLTRGLIIPFESQPGEDLEVRVRAALVGRTDAPESFVPAGKVHGFRVRLKNTGNVSIESQEIFITLDPEAKMLSLEVEEAPLELQDRIDCERQHGNRFTGRCVVPFLNQGQDFVVSLQSVENSTPACLVYAPGAGLRVHDMEFGDVLTGGLLAVAAMVGLGVMIAGTALLSSEAISQEAAIPFVAAGGAVISLSYVVVMVRQFARRRIRVRSIWPFW